MRTWRWLGVNESRIPADINEHVKTQKILVEAGKEDEVVLTQREGGQYELQVHIEEGAKLHLVNAQLVPDDALYTCRVKVFVGKGATFAEPKHDHSSQPNEEQWAEALAASEKALEEIKNA